MAKKKIPKKFTLALLICLGSFFTIVLICFAIMFLSPGTEILGFQYVNYTTALTKTYTNSSSDVSSVRAVKILTDCSSINVTAGEAASQISVNYNRKIYGFTKSENSQIVFSDKVIESLSFEQDSPGFYKTFFIKITEPQGWISHDESVLNVTLPSNISFEVIYLSSQKGNVTYSSSSSASISTENLYLTSGGGNISIANTQFIKNYYLKTNQGNVNFSPQTLTAEKLKFETNGGSLSFTNSSKTSTLTLSEGLFIKGNSNVTVDILNSNLEVQSTGGRFSFGKVGSSSSEKRVKINASSSTFNFGTIYGILTISGDLNASNNNLSVTKLVNSTKENININAGKGNVTLDEVSFSEPDSSLSISTTSGNISVRNISLSTTIYAFSSSGNISLSYLESTSCQPDALVKVFTETGNISLANISGFFEVEVLQNSSFSRLDITLCAVCFNTGSQAKNHIKAKNRDVLLTFKGYQNDLICRLFSKQPITLSDGMTSPVDPSDYDYILDQTTFSEYNFEYRVGYPRPETPVGTIYESKGKVLIDGSGKINIFF